jgi:succinate dehydrogenase / fumarate reductase flavoprotein subunit
MPPIRPDLLDLFDRGELKKYLTEEELPAPEPAPDAPSPAPAEETH